MKYKQVTVTIKSMDDGGGGFWYRVDGHDDEDWSAFVRDHGPFAAIRMAMERAEKTLLRRLSHDA